MGEGQVVVGLDNGGTTNNATVLDADGRFLVDQLVETPSRVREGPAVAVEALAESFEQILMITGLDAGGRCSASAWTRPGRPARTG